MLQQCCACRLAGSRSFKPARAHTTPRTPYCTPPPPPSPSLSLSLPPSLPASLPLQPPRIPGHGASYLGEGSQIPGGAARLDVFKHVVSVPDASKTTLAWSFSAFGKSELWVALITFL